MSTITDNLAVTSETTLHSETLPAMVDPPKMPHPQTNPCAGCPRYKADNIVRYGGIWLNQTTSRARWRNDTVPRITRCEFRVLTLLVMNQGYAVRYRAIYDVIQKPGFIAGSPGKGFADGCRTNVRSCIKRIRKKFQVVDPSFKNIVNHSSVGYSWSVD